MGKLPFYYKHNKHNNNHKHNKCNVCPIIFKRQNINYAYWAINSARKIFLKSSSVKDGSFL